MLNFCESSRHCTRQAYFNSLEACSVTVVLTCRLQNNIIREISAVFNPVSAAYKHLAIVSIHSFTDLNNEPHIK